MTTNKNTQSTNTELKTLKNLVKQYLKATECVPHRAVDCNQDLALDLRKKLEKIVK